MKKENLKLYNKYHDIFTDFSNDKIIEEEALLYIYLGEGLITKGEFDSWMIKLNLVDKTSIKQGHPKFMNFMSKYKAIWQHYRWGYCTLQEAFEAVEILEKLNYKKEDK